MSLSDDHVVGREDETWTLPDDPDDDASPPWPGGQSDRDQTSPT